MNINHLSFWSEGQVYLCDCTFSLEGNHFFVPFCHYTIMWCFWSYDVFSKEKFLGFFQLENIFKVGYYFIFLWFNMVFLPTITLSSLFARKKRMLDFSFYFFYMWKSRCTVFISRLLSFFSLLTTRVRANR